MFPTKHRPDILLLLKRLEFFSISASLFATGAIGDPQAPEIATVPKRRYRLSPIACGCFQKTKLKRKRLWLLSATKVRRWCL